jgi:VWFA-related protein
MVLKKMMRRVRALEVLAPGLLAVFCMAGAWAQAAPAGKNDQPAASPTLKTQPATTLSVQVKVVNVLATVRDKHGKIVNTLTKDDFTLTEDGHPQSIHYFTRESDLPLTLGLLVDTSMSQRRVLDQERSASHGFLNQMVRADKDKAFIIHFDREVELLQDLTDSREKLEAALGSLATPQLNRTSGGAPQDQGGGEGRGQGRHHTGGGTLLYDAIYLASDELMKKQQGRKALIVLSDGVDRGSKESLETAIATAQKADTAVYSILYKDDGGYGEHRGGFGMGGPMGGGMGRHGGGGYPRYPQESRPDGKKILDHISKETGGRFFEVSKKQSVDQIYAQIEEELRNQYSLGYTPDRGGTAEAGYHKIQLSAKGKDLAVQTRDGYYAGP